MSISERINKGDNVATIDVIVCPRYLGDDSEQGIIRFISSIRKKVKLQFPDFSVSVKPWGKSTALPGTYAALYQSDIEFYVDQIIDHIWEHKMY